MGVPEANEPIDPALSAPGLPQPNGTAPVSSPPSASPDSSAPSSRPLTSNAQPGSKPVLDEGAVIAKGAQVSVRNEVSLKGAGVPFHGVSRDSSRSMAAAVGSAGAISPRTVSAANPVTSAAGAVSDAPSQIAAPQFVDLGSAPGHPLDSGASGGGGVPLGVSLVSKVGDAATSQSGPSTVPGSATPASNMTTAAATPAVTAPVSSGAAVALHSGSAVGLLQAGLSATQSHLPAEMNIAESSKSVGFVPSPFVSTADIVRADPVVQQANVPIVAAEGAAQNASSAGLSLKQASAQHAPLGGTAVQPQGATVPAAVATRIQSSQAAVGVSVSCGVGGVRPKPPSAPAKLASAPLTGFPTYQIASSTSLTPCCPHYSRNCHLRAPCCNALVACRRCHDALVPDGHPMDRRAVKFIKCLKCDSPDQPLADECASCHTRFAAYFCKHCAMYDDSPNRHIFHCNSCGVCRLGKREDFRHCDTCRSCLPANSFNSHRCTPNVLAKPCALCHIDMHESVRRCTIPPCGHAMHEGCFEHHVKSSYACPTCGKSLADMTHFWKLLDKLLEKDLAGENEREQIMCRDCGKDSSTRRHPEFLKCAVQGCGSYNTTRRR